MSPAAVTTRRRARQKPSHSRLLQDVSATPTGGSRSGPLQAVIVPTSRPASQCDGLINLATYYGCVLVVLCSGQANVEQLAERVAKTPGARALIIEVPSTYQHDSIPRRTSGNEFRTAGGGRRSDLSLKRNLGLMIARLHGWTKIAFIDDDITLNRNDSLTRLAWQLDDFPIAGMACREFPDNSVVCHARRLAGLRQDNFISGAVLGVNCGNIPLPFFPDIYNEDWFFFSQAAARRELANVGNAVQAEYEPFGRPVRARHEEFGDLLAEGLFSLIEDSGPDVGFARLLDSATSTFWDEFRDARRLSLQVTERRLDRLAYEDGNELIHRALRSLAAAEAQLAMIETDHCLAFVEAWRDDLADWTSVCAGLNDVGSTAVAMDELGLRRWRVARFGDPDVSTTSRYAPVVSYLMASRS